ncbi:MAG: MBOAT family protein [Acidobacteriota bacterium]
MVFSSHLFCFVFLPTALALYYLLPRTGRHLALVALSYLFYGWANPAFTLLMAFSTLVDYQCGRVIAERPRSWHRPAVIVSVVTNLSLLAFFKYFNFAVDSWDGVIRTLGLEALELDVALQVVLPLGISFYTFQSMSYTIDVYRGQAKPLHSLIDFACYVSLFPQMVAGPIIRFREVDDQLRHRTHTLEKFARGAAMFALGMGKKVLLANPCGKVADTVFEAGSVLPLDAWLGVIAYAFQIYFDFSGYSDMAIGLGLMLGFVFPKNFDSPYHSRSITEFWRRWHISLSTWLRDYLYIPLGGNRNGAARTYVNLMIVMVLGGLWHGAAWTFVVWGTLQGVMLAAERLRGGERAWSFLPGPLAMVWTFVVVLVSWVFFRAATIGDAFAYLGAMVGWVEAGAAAPMIRGVIWAPYYLLTMVIAALVVWTQPQSWDLTRRLTPPRVAWCVIVFYLALIAMETQGFNPFIYFIF